MTTSYIVRQLHAYYCAAKPYAKGYIKCWPETETEQACKLKKFSEQYLQTDCKLQDKKYFRYIAKKPCSFIL
jgi:hypothetical protein